LGNKAVFLDRDGVICEDVEYMEYPYQIKLIQGVTKAIRSLNKNGFKIVIVSNQSGVARGYFTEEDVKRVNLKMISKLGDGCRIDAIYFCPHHPEIGVERYKKDCDCRKPKPGMLKSAAKDLDIDLKRSFMVGDKMDDVYAGHRAGCETILLLTGQGQDEVEYFKTDNTDMEKSIKPNNIASDLFEAVSIILKKVQK